MTHWMQFDCWYYLAFFIRDDERIVFINHVEVLWGNTWWATGVQKYPVA